MAAFLKQINDGGYDSGVVNMMTGVNDCVVFGGKQQVLPSLVVAITLSCWRAWRGLAVLWTERKKELGGSWN